MPAQADDDDCCKGKGSACDRSDSKQVDSKPKHKKDRKNKDMPADNKGNKTLDILSAGFTQSGGFAGINRGSEIVFQELDKQDQQKLKSLINASGILKATDTKKLNESARDVFIYTFKVTTAAGTSQAEYDDTTLPESFRPLMEFMRDHKALK